MKRHLRSLILFICSAFLLTGCGYAGPEKAVRKELDSLKKLNEATISSFISYEDIRVSSDPSSQYTDSDATEAIKLFFRDFQYHIDSSSQDKEGTTATVNVSITNLDAQALAKDLCREIYRNSLSYSNAEDASDEHPSSFSLMKKCLQDHEYPQKTTTATFHLTCQDKIWKIQESAQLENELTGGLVTCLSDPYLLSPEEILDLTLAPFKDFSSEDWQSYLNISDVFAVGTPQADEIDHLLFDQISNFFDYRITDVTQDGDSAQVTVHITSLDLNSVIENCLDPLRDYGSSTESIRASSEEFNQKTGEILINALKENTKSTVTQVTVFLHNDGHTWDPSLSEDFTDALLGNLDESLASLNEAAK